MEKISALILKWPVNWHKALFMEDVYARMKDM